MCCSIDITDFTFLFENISSLRLNPLFSVESHLEIYCSIFNFVLCSVSRGGEKREILISLKRWNT